ncbi:MAG: hypothetical protein AAGF92_10895 [Myxococcota bacterium]
MVRPRISIARGSGITNTPQTHDPDSAQGASREASRAPILFCPYCKEAFEARDDCPEHGLLLVTIDRLPKDLRFADDRVSFFLDPRYGRGAVLAGASAVLVGFALPFADSRGVVASALEVAIDGAYNLWMVPLAAIAMLLILAKRRSLDAMRASRGAIVALSLGALLPVAYTARRVRIMAALESADLVWGSGLVMMVAACLGTAVAAVFLGRRGRRGF